MKKKSFFERLTGNLRFNENEEEDTEHTTPAHTRRPLLSNIPPSPEPVTRELPLTSSTQEDTTPVSHMQTEEEEVGELPVDVYETQNEIVIQTLIAGVLPENLSISITRDMVTISGKREANKAVPNGAYTIRELYWGSFERTVELPEEVEIDSSEAIERHGMLMIKMPKLDKRRKNVLKIKSI